MINNILSNKEKQVYYTRVNLDGNKKMPFKKVAETLNMTLKEVKRYFNSAIRRLSTNPDFLRNFKNC
jgi:DNA-directed RNA polymerase sigma subunit (sigma70/sigma32)